MKNKMIVEKRNFHIIVKFDGIEIGILQNEIESSNFRLKWIGDNDAEKVTFHFEDGTVSHLTIMGTLDNWNILKESNEITKNIVLKQSAYRISCRKY